VIVGDHSAQTWTAAPVVEQREVLMVSEKTTPAHPMAFGGAVGRPTFGCGKGEEEVKEFYFGCIYFVSGNDKEATTSNR
jgi:hypothetical protein